MFLFLVVVKSGASAFAIEVNDLPCSNQVKVVTL